MRRRSSNRAALVLASTLACALVGTGCTDDVSYGYFEVQVSVDPVSVDMERLERIDLCAFFVKGAATAMKNLPCRRGTVPYAYGKIGWSTRVETGKVQFVVDMMDFNHVLLARGETALVDIQKDTVVPVNMVVRAVNSITDGGVADAATGADAASPPDGRADATATDGRSVADSGAD